MSNFVLAKPMTEHVTEITQTATWIEDLGNGVDLTLVTIPAGTCLMGSPKGEGSPPEYPQHQVTVNSFLMGMHVVTQRQWQQVAAYPMVKHPLISNPSYFKGEHRPVEQVSWQDAMEFCARLCQRTGRYYRLPSEAEWEYACRAGTTTPFHCGSAIAPHLANYLSSQTSDSPEAAKSGQETTEVGTFPPNPFQLYDLHGNVWEWCLDHWHDDYHGAPTDGSAWLSQGDPQFRVLRGGAWNMNAWVCRSAFRYAMHGGDWKNHQGKLAKYLNIGFRVVCHQADFPIAD